MERRSVTWPSDCVSEEEFAQLTRGERTRIGLTLGFLRLKEYASFDAGAFRELMGIGGLAAAATLRALGKAGKAFRLEASLHRRAVSAVADRSIAHRVAHQIRADRRLFEDHVSSLSAQPATQAFFKDPARLLGTRILVLKSPRDDEKGLLSLDYSFVFPLFARVFDVPAILKRYHILLEPSWSGYCDPDILCFAGLEAPVFVQAYEPRDRDFLLGLGSNLVPVGTAANWWIDHRVFRPLPEVNKDADVIMVASWARFKRHAMLFAVLHRLRRIGERMKVILIGYPNDCSREDIHRLGRYYGVADQLEMHERVPAEEVNFHYNRAKVNVIWSRMEGVNRAVIEGALAGTPSILRAGFNYGYAYPYINEQTGCFAEEGELADKLLAISRGEQAFRPREWVEKNMSPLVATRIVDQAIGTWSRRAGEKWEEGAVAVKLSQLDSQRYWVAEDQQRFAPDYDYLRSTIGHRY